MLGQIEALDAAVARLDAVSAGAWTVEFSKVTLTYAVAAVTTAADFANALVRDLGTQSAGSTDRALASHARLSDVATKLVPLIRAAQEGKVLPETRTGVLAALRTASREWRNIEIADERRSVFDARSGEYLKAKERLTARLSELVQGLSEVPLPGQALPASTVSGKSVQGVLGIALLGLGLAGLAIYLGRRLG